MRPATSPGGFTAKGSVGVVINTTPGAVDDTVTVGSTDVRDQRAQPAPADHAAYFAFVRARTSTSTSSDMLEIRGDFQIGNNGSFHGTDLEVFVGKGPSRLNGARQPGRHRPADQERDHRLPAARHAVRTSTRST